MMRCLLMLLLLLLYQPKNNAAVIVVSDGARLIHAKTLALGATISKELALSKHKPTFLQKIRFHIFQKKLKKSIALFEKDKSINRKKLSTLSLILGLAGIAFVFVPYVSILVLLLAPAAIVTGIIALKGNEDKKSRTKAIIGIVAGAVPLLILAALLAVFAIGGFSFAFE